MENQNQACDLSDTSHDAVWMNAPVGAFHWERLPNGKCVWHCRPESATAIVTKKAPNFKIEQKSLWRDAVKQKEANLIDASINTQLSKLNIVLV